ncbi:MAG: 2-amino-4-hydroxy-6-hydroxymethyldihydropteridine diphosphokinase [Desulfuromonas sp.]|nr:2-amino-4-hydroxy-6-hydroxymethyldihydropteridine diphosphokinase [Desulfuromonas sp.]
MADEKKVEAYIGFGANMGHCRPTFVRARQQFAEHGVRVLASSPLYQTAPLGGPPGQPDYLNAVIQVETRLDVEALLRLCLDLELQAGRERLERWGPRTLDLDLLLYGDTLIDTPFLQLPHPRLHQRRFVLEPLCQLAAELVHPRLHQTIKTLLAQLPSDGGVQCIEEQW